jgi:hypothetical protein
MEAQAIGQYVNSQISLRDATANDRGYISMTAIFNNLTRSEEFRLSCKVNEQNFDTIVLMILTGNPNVSRSLVVNRMFDPYIVGGI